MTLTFSQRAPSITLLVGLVACCSAILASRPARAGGASEGAPPSIPASASYPAYGDGWDSPAYRDGWDRPAPRPRYLVDWPEGRAAPAGYHWTEQKRVGFMVGGGCLLGSAWLFSANVGILLFYGSRRPNEPADRSHDPSYLSLGVPFAGPFVELQYAKGDLSTALIVDGLVQAAGAGIAIWAALSPRMRVVRDDIGAAARVVPTPMILGKGGPGLGLVGQF